MLLFFGFFFGWALPPYEFPWLHEIHEVHHTLYLCVLFLPPVNAFLFVLAFHALCLFPPPLPCPCLSWTLGHQDNGWGFGAHLPQLCCDFLFLSMFVLLLLIPETFLKKLVKIGSVTPKILLTLSLWWWVGGWCAKSFYVKPDLG